MTTYELPREPDADVIWTTSSLGASQPTVTKKWYRLAGQEHLWFEHGDEPRGHSYTWLDVLAHGVVHDTHPELGDVAPLPWTAEDNQPVTDAEGYCVDINAGDNASLVVRAIKAYAGRLVGGES